MQQNNREIAYAFLRITFGVMLFSYGFNKLAGGPAAFVSGMRERFADSLPESLVTVFAWTLPFAELLFGALLVLGLFTPIALLGTAALMLVLVFGAVMEPSPPIVANNMLFSVVVFVLIWLLEANRFSLDAWLDRNDSATVGFLSRKGK